MKKKRTEIWKPSILTVLLVMSIGCGSDGPTIATGTTAQTLNGNAVSYCNPYQYANCTTQQVTTDFSTGCFWSGGTIQSGLNGKQTCVIRVGYLSFPPVLSESGSSYPVTTRLQVKKGDTVTFSGSGAWGPRDYNSWLKINGFSLFGYWHYNCNEISLAGVKDGKTITNVELPAGLVGSDSTKLYFLGDNKSHTIENDGVFSFGLNVPNDQQNGICMTSWNLTITITR